MLDPSRIHYWDQLVDGEDEMQRELTLLPTIEGSTFTASTEHLFEILHDPFSGFTIPQRRESSFLPLPRHQSREGGRKPGGVRSDQLIYADRGRFWPFGINTQR